MSFELDPEFKRKLARISAPTDEFVRQNTTFAGWEEMKKAAALANVKKRWNG